MTAERRRWPWSIRSTVIVTVTTLLASVLVVLGVNAQGYPVTDVNLSESTVWVTNEKAGLVGRVNRQIDELNSSVGVTKPGFDVLQDGDQVLAVVQAKNEIRPLDVSTVVLTGRIGTPANATVSFGGGVLAIADPGSGAVWAGTPDSLAGLDPKSSPALLTTAAGVRVVSSVDGTVFAVAPGSDGLWSARIDDTGQPQGWASDERGKPVEPEPARLVGGSLTPVAAPVVSEKAPSVDLTAVGDTPVVLDRASGQLILPDRRVDVPGGDAAVLQQPGPATDTVLIATGTGLLRVPLAGGDPQTVVDGVSGTPSAPVSLNGCVHAAWASAHPTYAVACGGDAARTVAVPDASAAPHLVFRVNRDVIVLNDQATGNIWLVDADMKLITDWDDAQQQESSSDQIAQDGDQNSSDQLTNSRTDCADTSSVTSAAGTPPQAAADEFGVRAGRTTVLRVLDNDSSADCSMLAVSAVNQLPADQGTVAIAEVGQALQVTVPAAASGPLPAIEYTVDDGLGRTSTAQVSVTVTADDTRDPVQIRVSATIVEVGGTVAYNVLPDFRSPMGDDLALVSATTTTDDSVTFQPTGLVTFRDTGSAGAIKKTVDLVISDGTSQIGGTLTIDVKAEGTTKPVPGPVAVSGVVGEPVAANPLRSVLSGLRDPARVTAVQPLTPDQPATASAVLSPQDSTVVLTGNAAGTSYFLYTVVAGSASATGVIRFDVVAKPETPAPPVVTPDVGYLVPGRTLVIDPLANDRDPMGDVLAVAQLTQPADSPLTATVHDLSLVQVSSSRTVPPGGVTLTYAAANAVGRTTGQIRVIPVPAPLVPQPPVASDIAVTVRAGDAVTVPISKHAADPTGQMLTVKPFPDGTLPAEQGLVFATDSAIRYLAPAAPPPATVRFSYTVVNTDQLTDTRTVTISVVPADTSSNSAPQSPPLTTARVFAGRSATISLPLDGIDPDGDWVTFAGQTDPAPTLGRIDKAGPATVTYTALGSPGLDTAGYMITDPFGKQAKGSLRVTVIAPPAVAEPPVAPDLNVVVRPGRTVGVDALGTAYDPGGETEFSFAEPPLVVPDGITAVIADDTVVVTAPDGDGVFPIKYAVRNAKGLAASGILTVTVSATAPLAPPTAKDVFVDASMLSGDGATAAVDVAGSVTNRSGLVSDLTVSASGTGVSVDGRSVTVPVTDQRQVLAYRVTNLDDDTATSLVVVPPRAELASVQQQNQEQQRPASPPQARGDVTPFQINAGETATVPVRDYVQVDAGRTASVPAGAMVTATQGTAQRLDEASLQYSVPEDAGGAAAINVPVTDGTAPQVTIPIPVTIIPKVTPPPTFSGASMNVEKGSSATQDLAGLVGTANSEQAAALTFSGPNGLSNGLSGSLDGSVLTVVADPSAGRGTTSTATITVSDGTNTVTGSIAVSVVGSTAALPSVQANRQVEASAGEPVTVNALDGAYNPFPDTPLTILSATASNGTAVQTSGGSITVTPPAGVLDQFTVGFTVADVTGDADRQVQGTLTVIPLARPEAPTAVVATSLGKPDSVDVAWRAPALTRPAIGSFTVYWSGGSTGCGGDAGHCEVGPLTPGTAYTFEVSATNGEGEGARSAPSAQITPDVEPDTPAAPSATWAAPGSIKVTWQPPNNRGSAIVSYLLTTNTGEQRTVAAGSTTTTLPGLDPTVQVNVTVSATNTTGKTSQTSAPSNSLYPSDTTLAPGTPELTAGTDAGRTRTITATWAAAEPRGASAESYLVNVNGSTSTVTAPTTSYVITNVRDGQEYTVSVVSRNHVGDSDPSNSASLTTNPDPADVTDARATGTNGQVNVDVEASSGAGGAISEYRIAANGVEKGRGAGPTVTIKGLDNGTKYTFTAQACVSSSCSAESGASASATPYGPVGAPSVRVTDTSPTAVRFTWDAPVDNGRAPMQTRYRIDGGGWSNWANGGGTDVANGRCGQSHTIDVQARDSAGNTADRGDSASGQAGACPDPEVTIGKYGNAVGEGSGPELCVHSSCQYIRVDVRNFPDQASVTCLPSFSGTTSRTFSTNNNGAGGVDTGWYYGYPGRTISVDCNGGGRSATGSLTW
ncbi:MAG TPA: hypothetical protein VIU11_25425 [Nakamurella sp.]